MPPDRTSSLNSNLHVPTLVSHRGNMLGPGSCAENSPEAIRVAAATTLVEVDAWKLADRYYLGHDEPTFEVDKFFFFDSNILVHCKNVEAFLHLSPHRMVDCFFQSSEHVALSSRGRRILHSGVSIPEGMSLSPRDIVVDLECRELSFERSRGASILSDYAKNDTGVKSTENIPFDLLILDIDGVLTEGTKVYGDMGTPIAKEFCDRDFTAIKRFRSCGVEVCFLSADRRINEAMAQVRGIPFHFARGEDGNIDKSGFLADLRAQYEASRVAYVGDDYYDLTLLEVVDLSAAPSDALPAVLQCVDLILETPGGHGVVAELFDKTMSGYRHVFAYDKA